MKKIFILIVLVALAAGTFYFFSGREMVPGSNNLVGENSGNENLPEETYDFQETGNLVRNNPGMKANTWFLIYEKPGQPALNAELEFLPSSICSEGGEDSPCDPEKLEVGDRARVMGEKTGSGVVQVVRLEI